MSCSIQVAHQYLRRTASRHRITSTQRRNAEVPSGMPRLRQDPPSLDHIQPQPLAATRTLA